jgi:exonuclease V gamma subunit
LIPELLKKIRAVWTDPFTGPDHRGGPPPVIVPSPAVGKWLQMRLADNVVDGFGCVANLTMPTLEKYLWNALKPDEDMQLLHVTLLHQVVCGLLNASLDKELYAPLRAYLNMPERNSEPDPVKRVQLSGKIAQQFLEYEYNRPSVWDDQKGGFRKNGIDASWIAGKNYFEPGTGHEDWQKDLYKKTFECLQQTIPADGADGHEKTRYISLPHLYRLRRTKGLTDKSVWVVPPCAVFLFGVTKVSHFHRNLLVEISQMDGVGMQLFLTNPCAEFWEDINTRRYNRTVIRTKWSSADTDAGIVSLDQKDYSQEEWKKIGQVRENAANKDLVQDHELLGLWGDAGKENIFLWCPAANWDFEYFSSARADTVPGTLLQDLQRSLLLCQDNLLVTKDDGSLQVLACPDRGREVEELRERILDLTNTNADLKLNEIAVYLPDPAAYVPHIQRVFGAHAPFEPGFIPFSVLGAPGSDSLFARGMKILLELIEGRFDRAHVFGLLCNPIVQSSLKITPEEVSVWERWSEELGIYRGFDREYRESVMKDRGSAITDAHTFRLGMARMLIGNLAAGPVELGFQVQDGKLNSRIPPYRDYDTPDQGLLDGFCDSADRLHTDLCELNGAVEKGIPETIDCLSRLVWSWFGTIDGEAVSSPGAEALVRKDFLDSLSSIRLQNSLCNRESIAMKELIALVEGCLPEELGAISSAWTGGITFAPLRPAMIVPHRVIFVLGLDAATFPGTNEKPGWDLLSRKRIVGDSDRVRDNRFAFLELVHAAKERLILSYRSKNMQKEEELQPSSVVLELESYLMKHDVSVGEGRTRQCAIHGEVPWILHEALGRIAAKGVRRHGSWDPVAHALAIASAGKRVAHRQDLAGRKAAPVDLKKNGIRTNASHIRTFFRNPLEYHLSKTLGIENDESPATLGTTDEPLSSGALELSGLQRAVWTELLGTVFPECAAAEETDPGKLAAQAEETAGRIYKEYLFDGGSPEAQFYAMEQQWLITWAQECAQNTLELKTKMFQNHRFLINADLALLKDAIPGELTVCLPDSGTCTIECRHALALVPRETSEKSCVGIIAIKKEGRAGDNPDLWIEGALQWIFDKKNMVRRDISIVQLNRGNGKPGTVCHSCVAYKTASEKSNDMSSWLGGFLAAMLVDKCADHFPFVAIRELTRQHVRSPLTLEQRWAKVTVRNLEDALADENGGHGLYSCYLDAFKLTDAKMRAMTDREARKLAKTLFGPMIEGWIHG